MPYIIQQQKERYTAALKLTPPIASPGELNYLLSSICKQYLDFHGHTYGNMNDVVGALECAKLEFVRRVVSPYEDSKIQHNGDIYNP